MIFRKFFAIRLMHSTTSTYGELEGYLMKKNARKLNKRYCVLYYLRVNCREHSL